MKQAVSPVLLGTIKELQTLKNLQNFALAGGTNLAIRYNHRESIDIDLFCTKIIGYNGFKLIQDEVQTHYGENAFNFIDPTDINNQFTFLRFFIKRENTIIKVDLIQNMKTLDPIELVNGIRLFSVKDIGLFKLMSASSRPAKKDIYDLFYITKNISLIDLYHRLQDKHSRFNKKEDQNIFDLDKGETALDDPLLLLRFDNNYSVSKDKMMHSHDNIVIAENASSWREASINWRVRLRSLCSYLKIDFPSAKVR